MRGYALLFSCALLVGYASAAFNLPTIGQQVVQVWSDWYFVSERGLEDLDTVTITITTSPDDIDISNPTLRFSNVSREASFRLRPQTAGDYTLTFVMSDGNYDVRFIRAVNRTISVEGSFTSTFLLGMASEPYQVRLNYASEDDISVTPHSSTGNVRFTPSTIVIPAGSKAAPFRVTAYVQESSSVNYTITGTQASLYGQMPVNYITSVVPNAFSVFDLSSFYLLGYNSSSFDVWAPFATNTSVTVTPSAVDTTFSPSSVSLSSSSRVASFNYVSTSSAAGSRTVYFDVSGPDSPNYTPTVAVVTGITRKTITVQTPVDFVLNKKTHLSIRIAAPVVKDVTVYLYAGNLAFSPSNVTFKGDMTAAVVDIMPTDIGNDVITFKVGGSDQDYYTPPTDKALVVVSGGVFISPNSWYIPFLWLGVESPSIPVRVSIAPKTRVILIPQAPDMIFTPSSLVFTPTTMEQTFTITPVYTNKAATDPTVTSVTVDWILDGEDFLAYTIPASFVATVGRRSVQFKWSPHLTQTTANVLDLYLGKQYEFWATALYAPPTDLTVTPTNPYITFDPSVISFSSSVSHVKVIATVNASVGNTFIDWIVGGQNGGLYTVPTPQGVNTALRPINFFQAQIAPDDRVYPGLLIDNRRYGDISGYIGQNHVYWFSLMSRVIPDKSLTITPKSKHILFDPPSYELTFGDSLLNLSTTATVTTGQWFYVPDLYVVTTNFSVDALAPGTHEVWFELSGEDAQYYDIPSNVWVMSTKELRLASERSSASFMRASLAGLLVSLFAVFMLL